MLWCERAENKGTSHDKRKQDGGCETEKLWSHGAIFLVPISRLPIIRPSKYTLTDKNGARGDEWTAKLPFRRGDANAIQLSFQISYMQCAYTYYLYCIYIQLYSMYWMMVVSLVNLYIFRLHLGWVFQYRDHHQNLSYLSQQREAICNVKCY